MSPKRGPNWLPKLGHFLPRSCGRVRIPGRGDIYLGESGCWPANVKRPPPEVVEAYNREIARWTSARAEGRDERPVRAGCTIGELAIAYLKHCESWYRKRGKVTSQVFLIKRAVREVRRLFGTTPAADFGARDLRAVRDVFERLGTLNRRTINYHLGHIRRMFRWGVDEELIPEETWLRLKAVAGLQKGRSKAKEPGKVGPVPAEVIEATLPHLPPIVQAIIGVHRLCGMRPEEVCYMRAGDVIEDDGLLKYVVRDDANKLAHKDIARVVWLGPRAQAILRPWLEAARAKGPDAWVWPKRIGQGPTTPKRYLAMVSEACAAHGIPHWHPNQIRHSRGTETRKVYGLEGTQAELGHAQIETSQIYAMKNEENARRIARETG